MILRIGILIGIAYFYTPLSLWAQQIAPSPSPIAVAPSEVEPRDYSQTVIPITPLKLHVFGLEADFGTGFCLDSECRFIGTNYHVAVLGKPRKIRGDKIIRRFFATGPNDDGASLNAQYAEGRPMQYNPIRDLAIFELRKPLADCHGIPFSLDELQVGQEVEIYSYPKEGLNPFRSLRHFHGRFKGVTPAGLLAFDYSLSAGKTIRPGASGGIVVDSKSQQIVGILNEIGINHKFVVLAVPIESLAEFLERVHPWLAQRIFPTAEVVSEVSPDIYPKLSAAPSDVLQRRSEEPDDVKLLRKNAQALADGMRNYIAVQSYFWGSGNKGPLAAAAYEVRVIDGSQRFREYPDGRRELRTPPIASLPTGTSPGDEWSSLPAMVGSKLGVTIRQAPDAVVNGEHLKVFQYLDSAEDGLCRITDAFDFGFFHIRKDRSFASYGEVWTDQDGNILRISQHCERTGNWGEWQCVVTYGWLKRANEPRRLVPVAIAAQTEYKKKLYWCRGQFTNYREFVTGARLLVNSAPVATQLSPNRATGSHPSR